MGVHSVRMNDDLWRDAQAKATATSTTLTRVLELTLAAYVAEKWKPPATAADALQGRLNAHDASLESLARRLAALESLAGI
jgi:hypothetical protein